MPSVERLLDDLDVALLGISEVASTRLGHVTVACVPSAAYYFMPRVIAHYHRQFPRIKVKVLDSSAHDVLSAVVNGEADFGLSFMGTLEAEVDFEPLVQEGYVVACRRDHPLAGRSSVTWDEFYQQDYISLDKTSGNRFLLDQALTGVVPQRPSICETRHVTTMIGLGGGRVGRGGGAADGDAGSGPSDPDAGTVDRSAGDAQRRSDQAPGSNPDPGGIGAGTAGGGNESPAAVGQRLTESSPVAFTSG